MALTDPNVIRPLALTGGAEVCALRALAERRLSSADCQIDRQTD